MANTVDTFIPVDGSRNVAVRRTMVSDGTAETDAIFMDISTFSVSKSNGTPISLSVDRIEWDIQGITSVRLEFDATTDDELAILSTGSGAMDWTGVGGLKDPKSTGFTGDILITSTGIASGSTYTITIYAHKKY